MHAACTPAHARAAPFRPATPLLRGYSPRKRPAGPATCARPPTGGGGPAAAPSGHWPEVPCQQGGVLPYTPTMVMTGGPGMHHPGYLCLADVCLPAMDAPTALGSMCAGVLQRAWDAPGTQRVVAGQVPGGWRIRRGDCRPAPELHLRAPRHWQQWAAAAGLGGARFAHFVRKECIPTVLTPCMQCIYLIVVLRRLSGMACRSSCSSTTTRRA